MLLKICLTANPAATGAIAIVTVGAVLVTAIIKSNSDKDKPIIGGVKCG